MDEQKTVKRFNGAAWFDRQVQRRTRAALTQRGSKASTRSKEYKAEYARQLECFRAERAEVKRRKEVARIIREQNKAKAERRA